MAQSDASYETWIVWTMPSSTDEFSGRARSLIAVRNGACASCRQGGYPRPPLPIYMSLRKPKYNKRNKYLIYYRVGATVTAMQHVKRRTRKGGDIDCTVSAGT